MFEILLALIIIWAFIALCRYSRNFKIVAIIIFTLLTVSFTANFIFGWIELNKKETNISKQGDDIKEPQFYNTNEKDDNVNRKIDNQLEMTFFPFPKTEIVRNLDYCVNSHLELTSKYSHNANQQDLKDLANFTCIIAMDNLLKTGRINMAEIKEKTYYKNLVNKIKGT